MMNKWKYLLMAALWVVLACSREEEAPSPQGSLSAEGQKLKVEFSIPVPASDPSTKVLDNGGDISHLYVAVFGSSGYLKEYVEATFIDSDGETTYYTDSGLTDELGDPILIPHTVKLYHYSVVLTIAENPRTVHFLGNGPSSLPFGYDTAVMPIQMSQLNDQNQGEKAYWQMIDLPKGISAKRNSAGNYIDGNGVEFGEESFSGFLPDQSLVDKFQNIALIRNWAKIVLYTQEDSHFTPKSFAVINYPSRGAIAPYSGATGFVANYQNLGFYDLRDMGYPSNLPAGTVFDDSMPSTDAFTADPSSFVDGGRVAAALTSKEDVDVGLDTEGHAVYLYERPVPSEKIPPTYVIVYGHYRYPPKGNEGDTDYDPGDLEHEGDYYYKVDLMETTRKDNGEWESGYYPIYRNFKYQICITSILSMGHSTPAAAAASAGSADVSADITTGHLSDISDGIGRLHLTWMSQTYQAEHDRNHPVEDLKVFFGTIDGQPITGENAVTAKVLPPSDGGPDIILQVPTDDPENPEPFIGVISTGSDAGWRPVRFCTAAPGKTIRSQTLRITGNHDKGRLYRDVVITVLPTQEMRVACGNTTLHAIKDSEQSISISIPEGLTKSIFPLEFEIEPQDLTLTPDNSKPDNNLPVVMGKSISEDDGYAGKDSYHFSKTLTWDDYKKASLYESSDDKIWRTFTCYFKTNCNNSATKVWVTSQYFYTTSTEFFNYGSGQIHSAVISDPIPRESDKTITFKFSVEPDENGVLPEMTLRLRGLINGNDNSAGLILDDVDTYVFTPSKVENTLKFITTNSDGDLELELSAPGYNTVSVVPFIFNKNITTRSFGILDGVVSSMTKTPGFWSNVAYGRVQTKNNRNNGKDRGVIFGYYDDPDSPNPAVTLTDWSGAKLSGSNSSGLKVSNPSSFPAVPTLPTVDNGYRKDSRYHEIQLQTVEAQNSSDIYLTLSAPGYLVEQYHYPRLGGPNDKTHIHSSYFTQAKYNEANRTFTVATDTGTDDRSSFRLTIDPLDNAPTPYKNSNGIFLGQVKGGDFVPGSRYQITVESGNMGIFSGENNYVNNQRFFCGFFEIRSGYEPASMTPANGCGTCFLYPGNDRIYEWLTYDSVDEYEKMTTVFTPSTNPVKTIVIEVGDSNPVCITRFTYKAISNVL